MYFQIKHNYQLGMGTSPHSSESTKKCFLIHKLGTEDKPLFLETDKGKFVRSIVWPFASLKASSPTYGRTEHNDNEK